MNIKGLLNKKREIIELNREESRNTIKKRLEILSRKIEEDKDLQTEILLLNVLANDYIFIITDQFLLCRYIDTFNGCTFSGHSIKDENGYKEMKYNVKFDGIIIDKHPLALTVFTDYIKDPYFCINYDEKTDEYSSSTIYKDLINL